jgi:hypothetical protein
MRRHLSAAALGLGLGLLPALAGAQPSLEYAVKAAYLTKFIPFIQWPDGAFAGAGAPLTICVLGDDPFGGQLDKTAGGLKAGARAVAVRHITAPESGCQILFLASPDAAADASALAALRGKPVLTVTDSGAPMRGVISFVVTENHVRFDIDDALAAQDGLSISSKLLSLAHAVRQRGQP